MSRLRATDDRQLTLVLDDACAIHEPSVQAPPAQPGAAPRRLLVGAEVFTYHLRRVRRRTIGFQIDDRGLTISAPRWVSLRDIEAAIVEKRRWIASRQQQWLQWRQKNRVPPMRFADGATLPYLGTHLTLRLAAAATRREGMELHLALPAHAVEAQVRDAVQAWLQSEARRVFDERIARFADRIGPRYAGWRLSSARSQWGSCTHDGRIRLSWRLIHFSLPVIDYVVAHELAHLQELNHGPRFWRAVDELLPGFEPARDEIRGVDMAALPL